jgi:hypothetical protein
LAFFVPIEVSYASPVTATGSAEYMRILKDQPVAAAVHGYTTPSAMHAPSRFNSWVLGGATLHIPRYAGNDLSEFEYNTYVYSTIFKARAATLCCLHVKFDERGGGFTAQCMQTVFLSLFGVLTAR